VWVSEEKSRSEKGHGMFLNFWSTFLGYESEDREQLLILP
jgi:hypothetical protein